MIKNINEYIRTRYHRNRLNSFPLEERNARKYKIKNIMKKFTDKINESSNWWEWKKKSVTGDWFNSASDDEISRFIIGYNDGQGDHRFYTYSKIVDLLNNSDRPNQKELENMTRVEIIDEFYKELHLNGNNSNTVYFDGKEYLMVDWI